jgi:alanine racemase
MTHFSDADAAPGSGADGLPDSVTQQLVAFEAAASGLGGERSLANSAATLRYAADMPRIKGDWVRPGIMLYGSSPDHPLHASPHWDLQPTMTLRSQLIGVQSLKAGDAVGYGSTFVASEPMRIGVVACGYADGYPRHAGTGTPMLVNGVRTRLIGRVSMDMVTVDLAPVGDARVGDEATLWGHGPGGTVLGIDEVAAAAGTVGYELMCAVTRRVPFSVRDHAAGSVALAIGQISES